MKKKVFKIEGVKVLSKEQRCYIGQGQPGQSGQPGQPGQDQDDQECLNAAWEYGTRNVAVHGNVYKGTDFFYTNFCM